MTTSLELDIQRHLRAYWLGETTREAFNVWFLPATFHITSDDDVHLVSLAGEIQLRVAEFDAGHWTESEILEQLHRILNTSVEHVLG